jgi:excisionase family DNA binding protein
MKTLSDLQRYLKEKAKILTDLDRYGLPDHLADGSTPDSYFVEVESAEMLADCQREAAAFGYEGGQDVPTTSPRGALTELGKIVEWAQDKAEAERSELTVREAARLLRVSRGKILGWIAGGRLPADNVGRGKPRYRIKRVDLDTFLAGRAKTAERSRPRRQKRPSNNAEIIEFFPL